MCGHEGTDRWQVDSELFFVGGIFIFFFLIIYQYWNIWQLVLSLSLSLRAPLAQQPVCKHERRPPLLSASDVPSTISHVAPCDLEISPPYKVNRRSAATVSSTPFPTDIKNRANDHAIAGLGCVYLSLLWTRHILHNQCCWPVRRFVRKFEGP